MYDLLKSNLEKQHIHASIKIINNKNVKIKRRRQNNYRKITRQLTEAGNTWHSYENKNTRPIRVMAKGIHPFVTQWGS
jgi:hypothetical protein